MSIRLVLLFLLGFLFSSFETSEVRIFCVIKTFGKNLPTRASIVDETWAKRCDKRVFLTAANSSEAENTSLQLLKLHDVSDSYVELSIKVYDALNLIMKQQPYDFDWLLLADDDTYVIIEHLRRILHVTEKPLAFGHLFAVRQETTEHLSGGAGYAINVPALKLMLPDLQTTCADWYMPGMEDVYVSRCLQHLNVTLDGAIDSSGRHRFYPLSLMDMYSLNIPDWFTDYNKMKFFPGFDCCSKEAISFHYVSTELMNLIEWARYIHDDDSFLG